MSFLSFINVIAPLAVWLIKRGESAFVDDQGREAINFQASWSIYWMVAAVPLRLFTSAIPPNLLIRVPILIIAFSTVHIVLIIWATVRSSQGRHHRYPATIRFI